MTLRMAVDAVTGILSGIDLVTYANISTARMENKAQDLKNARRKTRMMMSLRLN